jgi:hypothetical protein
MALPQSRENAAAPDDPATEGAQTPSEVSCNELAAVADAQLPEACPARGPSPPAGRGGRKSHQPP